MDEALEMARLTLRNQDSRDPAMGVRFLTGGESSPNGIIGLDFVLERSMNEGATAGIAPATKSVVEKGGHSD